MECLEHVKATLTPREAQIINEFRKWRAAQSGYTSVVFTAPVTLCCSVSETEPNPPHYGDGPVR